LLEVIACITQKQLCLQTKITKLVHHTWGCCLAAPQ